MPGQVWIEHPCRNEVLVPGNIAGLSDVALLAGRTKLLSSCSVRGFTALVSDRCQLSGEG